MLRAVRCERALDVVYRFRGAAAAEVEAEVVIKMAEDVSGHEQRGVPGGYPVVREPLARMGPVGAGRPGAGSAVRPIPE